MTGGSFEQPQAGTSVSTTTSTSFLGGAQVGVNYEFGGGVVIGAEAMFDWLPNTKNTVNLNNAASGANLGRSNINNRWLTTATGKLGYAWDRVLLYAKGGGAWVGTNSPRTPTFYGGAPVLAFFPVLPNKFGLDCGCRCGMGIRGQLVGARRVRLYQA